MKLYYPILIIILTILYSCNNEITRHEPIDPCANAKDVEAKIISYDSPLHFSYKEYTDTLLDENNAFFTCEEDYDSYEWLIGDEADTRTGKTVGINFKGFKGKIRIRLIVKDSLDSCNSNYKRIDTAYKDVFVIPLLEARIIREYLGTDSGNPDEEYKIRIDTVYWGYDLPYHALHIFNFPQGCNYLYRDLKTTEMKVAVTNKKVFFHVDLESSCNGPRGVGRLDMDNQLMIDYEKYQRKENGQWNFENLKEMTYEGIKVK